MTDILTSVTKAVEILNKLKTLSDKLKNVELKENIAELSLELSETKMKIADQNILISTQKQEINSLKERFKNKQLTVRFLGARYFKDENGEPTGTPFCPICYSKNLSFHPIVSQNQGSMHRKCGVCQNIFKSDECPKDAQHYISIQKDASSKLGTEYIIKTYP
ncbi:hypothetical protein OAO18_07565 [Francisellaceae bacterium]|nr:hypothetical protein [Francisellaceae bacterium]